jgi:hypothetical protein
VSRLFTSKDFTWRGKRGTTDASDLGLPAGSWPLTMEVKSERTGVIEPFQQSQQITHGGEFAGLIYNSPNGIQLHVLND